MPPLMSVIDQQTDKLREGGRERKEIIIYIDIILLKAASLNCPLFIKYSPYSLLISMNSFDLLSVYKARAVLYKD